MQFRNRNSKLFDSWSFTRANYLIFAIGLLTIFFGYILMATGKTTSVQATKIAPVILVIGYCVIIPISIMYNNSDKNTKE